MGFAICVEGDTLTTGHACVGTTTLDTPPQSKVTIRGKKVAIAGTPTVSHPFPPSPPCAPHIAQLNKGSGSVSIGGIPVGRVTDSADAGAMSTGSDGSGTGAAGGTAKVTCGGPSVAPAP